MLVLAHRGLQPPGAAEHPDNTLDSFARAAAAGVDGIETDVRLGRDGVPLLFHDRFAGGRPVASLTAAELSAAVGYPVPILDEALASFPDLFWNLELKTPEAVVPTLERVRRLAPTHRFLVSSFWHPAVAPFAGIPGVGTALLLASRPSSLPALLGLFQGLSDGGPEDGAGVTGPIRTLVWSWDVVDPGLLAGAMAQGLGVWVYGVEDEEEHRQAAALPLEGVITDRPERLPRPGPERSGRVGPDGGELPGLQGAAMRR